MAADRETDWKANVRTEALALWRSVPDKALFVVLLVSVVALFHFLGTANFGWVKNPSMFAWMRYVYTTSADDQYCMAIPFVVLGLYLWKRRELTALAKGIWWPAVGIVAAGLFLHVLGYMVQQV